MLASIAHHRARALRAVANATILQQQTHSAALRTLLASAACQQQRRTFVSSAWRWNTPAPTAAAPAPGAAPTNTTPAPPSNEVSMVMYGDGFERRVTGRVGETLLNVAQLNDVDQIEGACEGCMCCSTCHMVFDEATFKAIGQVSDDEQDIIDRAAGATDTSRLGCQVRVSKALEGARIRIPSEFTNQMI